MTLVLEMVLMLTVINVGCNILINNQLQHVSAFVVVNGMTAAIGIRGKKLGRI